jgi:hypothetical protein
MRGGFLFACASTADGLVLPNGVGMIRIEINQIAELINLRSSFGVWAVIAVTFISGLR